MIVDTYFTPGKGAGVIFLQYAMPFYGVRALHCLAYNREMGRKMHIRIEFNCLVFLTLMGVGSFKERWAKNILDLGVSQPMSVNVTSDDSSVLTTISRPSMLWQSLRPLTEQKIDEFTMELCGGLVIGITSPSPHSPFRFARFE